MKNSELGQRYRKLLEETVSVEMGGIAPDFTAKNINGRDVSLSSFPGGSTCYWIFGRRGVDLVVRKM